MMKKFDDIFRDKVHSYKANIPAGAWETLERRRRKKRFIFFLWSVLGLLFIGGGILIKITYLGKSGNDNLIAEASQHNGKKMSKEQNFKVNEPADRARDTKGAKGVNDPALSQMKKINGVEKIQSSETFKVLQESTREIKPVQASSTNTHGVERKDNLKSSGESKKNYVQTKSRTKTSITGELPEYDSAGRDERMTKNEPAHKDQPVINDDSSKSIQQGMVVHAVEEGKENNLPKKPLPEPKLIVSGFLKKTDTGTDTVITGADTKNKIPEKKQKQFKRPWFVDLTLIPLQPVREMDDKIAFSRNLVSNSSSTEFKSRDVKVSLDPAVALSLGLRKQITKHLLFGAGLQYVKFKENILISGRETTTTTNTIAVVVDAISGPQLNYDTVFVVAEKERVIEAVNSYTMLSIPVFVQYDLLQRKNWSFSIIGGSFINILNSYRNEIDKKAEAPLISASPGNTTTSAVNLYGGLRLGRRLGNRLELSALPSLRWNFIGNKINNSLFNRPIQQLSLGIGISYKLN